MKRIIGVILILVMLMSAAACNRAVVEKEGEQASNVEVSMFVDSKSEGGQAAIPEYKATTPMPNFEEIKTDDDLPF